MGTGPIQQASARLSHRELEVARLVAEGLTNREIADRLFISKRTVDGHLERMCSTWPSTVRSETKMRLAISRFVMPSATSSATSLSRLDRAVVWPFVFMVSGAGRRPSGLPCCSEFDLRA